MTYLFCCGDSKIVKKAGFHPFWKPVFSIFSIKVLQDSNIIKYKDKHYNE